MENLWRARDGGRLRVCRDFWIWEVSLIPFSPDHTYGTHERTNERWALIDLFVLLFLLTSRRNLHGFMKASQNRHLSWSRCQPELARKGRGFFFSIATLPETNILHLKINPWKRRFLLETIIFRGYVMLVSGSVNRQLQKHVPPLFLGGFQMSPFLKSSDLNSIVLLLRSSLKKTWCFFFYGKHEAHLFLTYFL